MGAGLGAVGEGELAEVRGRRAGGCAGRGGGRGPGTSASHATSVVVVARRPGPRRSCGPRRSRSRRPATPAPVSASSSHTSPHSIAALASPSRMPGPVPQPRRGRRGAVDAADPAGVRGAGQPREHRVLAVHLPAQRDQLVGERGIRELRRIDAPRARRPRRGADRSAPRLQRQPSDTLRSHGRTGGRRTAAARRDLRRGKRRELEPTLHEHTFDVKRAPRTPGRADVRIDVAVRGDARTGRLGVASITTAPAVAGMRRSSGLVAPSTTRHLPTALEIARSGRASRCTCVPTVLPVRPAGAARSSATRSER